MQLYQTGTLLLDRYQIERPLGVGGQAVVYLATHLGLGRHVAIKTIRLDQNNDALRVVHQRFEREARLLAQLNDPHTITLHDYGHTPDGSMFMVFEFIDGHTLKERLIADGAFSPAQTIEILQQILHAISEAHDKGALHRDLKPANIMLHEQHGQANQVKVLDFGVAKMIMEGAKLTGVNNFVGTPRYLAPEIIRQEELTPAYDIYALGMLAYNMLTGTHPMAGLEVRAVFEQLMSDQSHRLPEHLGISPELEAIVHRMLEKSLERRYTDTKDILRDLKALSPQPTYPLARKAIKTPTFAKTQQMHAIVGPPMGAVISEAEETGVFEHSTHNINTPSTPEPTSPEPPAAAATNASSSGGVRGESISLTQEHEPVFTRRVPDRVKARSEQLDQNSIVGGDDEQPVRGQSATFTREHRAVKPLTSKIVVDELPFEKQSKPEPQIGTLANIRPTVQRTASQLTSQLAATSVPSGDAHHLGAALAKQHAPSPTPVPLSIKIGLVLILGIFVLAIVVVIFAVMHM